MRFIPSSRRGRAALGAGVISFMAAAGAGYAVLYDGARVCTAAGCHSAVAVELRRVPERVVAASLCTQDRCETTRRGGYKGRELSHASVPLRGSERRSGRRVRVDLRLLDRTGREVQQGQDTLTLSRHAPNGLRCGPICFGASAVFQADTGTIEPYLPPGRDAARVHKLVERYARSYLHLSDRRVSSGDCEAIQERRGIRYECWVGFDTGHNLLFILRDVGGLRLTRVRDDTIGDMRRIPRACTAGDLPPWVACDSGRL